MGKGSKMVVADREEVLSFKEIKQLACLTAPMGASDFKRLFTLLSNQRGGVSATKNPASVAALDGVHNNLRQGTSKVPFYGLLPHAATAEATQ